MESPRDYGERVYEMIAAAAAASGPAEAETEAVGQVEAEVVEEDEGKESDPWK